MDLQKLFPGGEYGRNGASFLVKDGQFFWAVAEMNGQGEWELTERGKAIVPAPVVEPPFITEEPIVDTPTPKKRGRI